jgi:hypothetical protein
MNLRLFAVSNGLFSRDPCASRKSEKTTVHASETAQKPLRNCFKNRRAGRFPLVFKDLAHF